MLLLHLALHWVFRTCLENQTKSKQNMWVLFADERPICNTPYATQYNKWRGVETPLANPKTAPERGMRIICND